MKGNKHEGFKSKGLNTSVGNGGFYPAKAIKKDFSKWDKGKDGRSK